MRHLVFAAVSSLALAACSMSGQDNDTGEETTASADSGSDYGYDTYSDDNLADSMASDDQAMTRTSAEADGNSSNMGSADAIPDPEDRPIMQAQVVLDRIGFGPGVIDGKMGMSTENALMGFQEANDLDTTGELDEATKQALSEWERIPATRVVTIPENWGEVDYVSIPEDTAAKVEIFAKEGLVNVVGGCCGTTPEHIRAIAEHVAPYAPRQIRDCLLYTSPSPRD